MITKKYYPNPIRLEAQLLFCEQVNKHRNLDCIFYEICLDRAIIYSWESFSCRKCKLYVKEPL
jgi:hypothetical protein